MQHLPVEPIYGSTPAPLPGGNQFLELPNKLSALEN